MSQCPSRNRLPVKQLREVRLCRFGAGFEQRLRYRLLLVITCLCVQNVRPLAADETTAVAPWSQQPRLLVVLIGGMDSDPTDEQIAGSAERGAGNSGLYQLRCELAAEERVIAEYFNWNGSRAGEIKVSSPPRSAGIADFLRAHVQAHPRDRLALVGNSWGGHTACEVAKLLYRHETPVAVDLCVLLDPSSAGRPGLPPKSLPDNLNRVVHYHTRNMFVWKKLPAQPRLEDVDLGDPAQGYLRGARRGYAARFNFRAHVAAEWDEQIHAEIRRRLLDIVPTE